MALLQPSPETLLLTHQSCFSFVIYLASERSDDLFWFSVFILAYHIITERKLRPWKGKEERTQRQERKARAQHRSNCWQHICKLSRIISHCFIFLLPWKRSKASSAQLILLCRTQLRQYYFTILFTKDTTTSTYTRILTKPTLHDDTNEQMKIRSNGWIWPFKFPINGRTPFLYLADEWPSFGEAYCT